MNREGSGMKGLGHQFEGTVFGSKSTDKAQKVAPISFILRERPLHFSQPSVVEVSPRAVSGTSAYSFSISGHAIKVGGATCELVLESLSGRPLQHWARI